MPPSGDATERILSASAATIPRDHGWIRSDDQPIVIGADCAGIGSGIQGIKEVCAESQVEFISETCDDARHICQDYALPKHTTSDLTKRRSGQQLPTDVYIAGFPCQPYSALGHRMGPNDAKGRAAVVHGIIDYIQSALPTVFILENVRGFKSNDGGHTYLSFMKRLMRIKERDGKVAYYLKELEVNSRDFGTPQTRHRIFFVGIRLRHKHPTSGELVLPNRVEPPDLEEYLDPKPVHSGLRHRFPGSRAADDNLRAAQAIIAAEGLDPWELPYVVDVDTSVEWRPKRFVCGRVPCLTYSKTSGFWITNRGRRMTPAECMRIQGISARQTAGLPDGFIRACVGNSMTVCVVSAIARAAFSLVRFSW